MRTNILKIFSLLLLGATLGSCNEAADFEDVILFTGTESTSTRRFVVEGPEKMGISITATDKVDKDTKVSLGVVPELVELYNSQTGKNFKMLPDGSYKLESSEVLIKQGTAASENVNLALISFDEFEEGVSYCVPISITGTDGSMKVLNASKTMFVEIVKKTITRAADTNWNAFNVPSFIGNPEFTSLSKITMECRVLIKSFPSEGSNPGISSLMGIEENFLLRFGDISIPKNQLQLAPGVVGGKKYFTTGNTNYATNRWYHVAAVFDGGSIAIYVDGKLDVKFSTDPGSVDLTTDYCDGFWIGQSAGGRYMNGLVSEARIWERALTPNELQENLCYVDPSSEGLIAYWRFNDIQEDGTILDVTGHGHNAKPNRAVTFVEGVKCPN